MHGLCCTYAQAKDEIATPLAVSRRPQARAYRHYERLFLRHSLNWQTCPVQSLDLSTSTKASIL